MTNKCDLAFRKLAPFIYKLKAAAYGLPPLVPEELEGIDTPQKALDWVKRDVPVGKVPTATLYPLKSILSEVRLSSSTPKDNAYYYQPQVLSAGALMAQKGVPSNIQEATRSLWEDFLEALDKIPQETVQNWSLWFEALLGAWQSVSWCLTESKEEPDNQIPLYETSRVKAVLDSIEGEEVLLIQGDFQGIQDFIFTRGSQVNKKSAKLLRGRSFYVSLITELGALAVLENLRLCSLNLINQAAGKFLIVAENTEENQRLLDELNQKITLWFIDHTMATSNISLAHVTVKKEELREESGTFEEVMERLFEENEVSKLKRPCLIERESPVLDIDYRNAVSEYDERFPKNSPFVKDQFLAGEKLVKTKLLCISKNKLPVRSTSELAIFGYHFTFLDRGDIGKIDGEIIRLWDFSLPEDFNQPLFNGFARRDINGYVSRFSYPGEAQDRKYRTEDSYDFNEEGSLKTFEHLSCEDRTVESDGSHRGVVALGVLKGDVDNLGKIFREGLSDPQGKTRSTLCRMLTVSRMLQSFFTIYLPVLCRKDFPNTYTIFAGGDDFFMVGPWHGIQDFAFSLREKFDQFVANKDIHFSAGVALVKPMVPPRTIARLAEAALTEAKSNESKNALSVYGVVVPWSKVGELRTLEEQLDFFRQRYDISSSYLYSLFEIMGMADRADKNPRASIWRSRLSYNTARMASRKHVGTDELLRFIVDNMERYRKSFRIPLSNLFYQIRNS